ncbi:MAG: hypothetical protein BWX68_02910 [Verrucomicrobia bacterium ADurb.Bin063]|nr:MAG: hypothetical protein BWX68_02910 [Verrucomicrobia bacterium ADurb.Bin063]
MLVTFPPSNEALFERVNVAPLLSWIVWNPASSPVRLVFTIHSEPTVVSSLMTIFGVPMAPMPYAGNPVAP